MLFESLSIHSSAYMYLDSKQKKFQKNKKIEKEPQMNYNLDECRYEWL
jgi:hypothetical protein